MNNANGQGQGGHAGLLLVVGQMRFNEVAYLLRRIRTGDGRCSICGLTLFGFEQTGWQFLLLAVLQSNPVLAQSQLHQYQLIAEHLPADGYQERGLRE